MARARLIVCTTNCKICLMEVHERTEKAAIKAAKKCERKGRPKFTFSVGSTWKKGKNRIKVIDTKVAPFHHTPMYQVTEYVVGRKRDEYIHWCGEKQLRGDLRRDKYS